MAKRSLVNSSAIDAIPTVLILLASKCLGFSLLNPFALVLVWSIIPTLVSSLGGTFLSFKFRILTNASVTIVVAVIVIIRTLEEEWNAPRHAILFSVASAIAFLTAPHLCILVFECKRGPEAAKEKLDNRLLLILLWLFTNTMRDEIVPNSTALVLAIITGTELVFSLTRHYEAGVLSVVRIIVSTIAVSLCIAVMWHNMRPKIPDYEFLLGNGCFDLCVLVSLWALSWIPVAIIRDVYVWVHFKYGKDSTVNKDITRKFFHLWVVFLAFLGLPTPRTFTLILSIALCALKEFELFRPFLVKRKGPLAALSRAMETVGGIERAKGIRHLDILYGVLLIFIFFIVREDEENNIQYGTYIIAVAKTTDKEVDRLRLRNTIIDWYDHETTVPKGTFVFSDLLLKHFQESYGQSPAGLEWDEEEAEPVPAVALTQDMVDYANEFSGCKISIMKGSVGDEMNPVPSPWVRMGENEKFGYYRFDPQKELNVRTILSTLGEYLGRFRDIQQPMLVIPFSSFLVGDLFACIVPGMFSMFGVKTTKISMWMEKKTLPPKAPDGYISFSLANEIPSFNTTIFCGKRTIVGMISFVVSSTLVALVFYQSRFFAISSRLIVSNILLGVCEAFIPMADNLVLAVLAMSMNLWCEVIEYPYTVYEKLVGNYRR